MANPIRARLRAGTLAIPGLSRPTVPQLTRPKLGAGAGQQQVPGGAKAVSISQQPREGGRYLSSLSGRGIGNARWIPVVAPVRDGGPRPRDRRPVGRRRPGALAASRMDAGHMLTYLARNAEGGTRLLNWARTGVPSYEYGGLAARAAAIEQGTGRLVTARMADVHGATDGAVRRDGRRCSPQRTRLFTTADGVHHGRRGSPRQTGCSSRRTVFTRRTGLRTTADGLLTTADVVAHHSGRGYSSATDGVHHSRRAAHRAGRSSPRRTGLFTTADRLLTTADGLLTTADGLLIRDGRCSPRRAVCRRGRGSGRALDHGARIARRWLCRCGWARFLSITWV